MDIVDRWGDEGIQVNSALDIPYTTSMMKLPMIDADRSVRRRMSNGMLSRCKSKVILPPGVGVKPSGGRTGNAYVGRNVRLPAMDRHCNSPVKQIRMRQREESFISSGHSLTDMADDMFRNEIINSDDRKYQMKGDRKDIIKDFTNVSCNDCNGCVNCRNCFNCDACYDCINCLDCVNCRKCYNCVGLKNKEGVKDIYVRAAVKEVVVNDRRLADYV